MTCIHLGDKLRDEIGQCCGSKGLRIPVFNCSVHGEASQQLFSAAQRKQKDAVYYCAVCEQRMEKKPTSLVYIYSHRWAEKPYKDELRWSLRSLANIQGDFEPVIVGSPPEWYTGKKIVMADINGKYCDTTAKFIAACNSDLVSESFLTMMDDTLIWNPIELADLMIPRYVSQGVPGRSSSAWATHIRKTLEQCESFGFTTYDCGTHWPYPFCKQKLLETIEKFQATAKAVCVEVAYPNMHQQPVKRLSGEFIRIKKTIDFDDSIQVLNYARITTTLRARFAVRFAKKSVWEINEPVYAADAIPPRSLRIANDACVHLGDFKRQVPNPGKGRSIVFDCKNFNADCTIGKVPGIDLNCVKCPARAMRGKELFVEVA